MRNSRVVHGMEQKVRKTCRVPRYTASQEVIETRSTGSEGVLVASFSSRFFSAKHSHTFFGSVSAIIIIAQLTISSNYVRVSFSHIYFVNFKFFSLI